MQNTLGLTVSCNEEHNHMDWQGVVDEAKSVSR